MRYLIRQAALHGCPFTTVAAWGSAIHSMHEKGRGLAVGGGARKNRGRLGGRGAEAAGADADDAGALPRALTGAEGVYALIPPHLTSENYRRFQDQVSDAMAAAIEAAGVKHVVTLSSVGADKPEKTGPVAGLHYVEERFADISEMNVLHLRAGYFMEKDRK